MDVISDLKVIEEDLENVEKKCESTVSFQNITTTKLQQEYPTVDEKS